MILLTARTRALLGALVLLVLVAGIVVAAVRPGDLGDDDGPDRQVAPTTTSSTLATTTTSVDDDGATTSTTAGGAPVGGATSPPPAGGSGLGAGDAGRVGDGALADTGGTSPVAGGFALLALGLVAAASRRRPTSP